MSATNNPSIKRNTERIFLLLLTVVISVLFYKMYLVLQPDFAQVPSRLSNGTMTNLNGAHPAENMKLLLQKGRYFHDEKDIDLISSTFENARLADSLPVDNIGDLNKRQYSVNAQTALLEGGESFQKRVTAERIALGFSTDDSAIFVLQKTSVIAAVNNLQMGNHSINGIIKSAGDDPVVNVIVRLQLVLPQDSLYSNNVEEIENNIQQNSITVRKIYAVDSLHHTQLQSLVAYTQTDANGNFSFTNLPDDKTFEVLPLQLNST
ncbi:MAG: cell cycle protein, partial [Parafilimonas sp.]